jgi:hypothetical protein
MVFMCCCSIEVPEEQARKKGKKERERRTEGRIGK